MEQILFLIYDATDGSYDDIHCGALCLVEGNLHCSIWTCLYVLLDYSIAIDCHTLDVSSSSNIRGFLTVPSRSCPMAGFMKETNSAFMVATCTSVV